MEKEYFNGIEIVDDFIDTQENLDKSPHYLALKKEDRMKKIKRLMSIGYGAMDCKKALEQSDDDEQAALSLLRCKGSIDNRLDRETTCGCVASYIHNDRLGVIIEVNCETDFVARTEEFKTFVKELMLQIASARPGTVRDLMGQKYIRDESKCISDLYKEIVNKTKENIVIQRFDVYKMGEPPEKCSVCGEWAIAQEIEFMTNIRNR